MRTYTLLLWILVGNGGWEILSLQGQTLSDTLQANQLYELAYQYTDSTHSDSALFLYATAATQYRQLAQIGYDQGWNKCVKALGYLGSLYREKRQFAKAEHILDSALNVAQTHLDPICLERALVHNNRGVVHSVLNQYPEARHHFQKTLDIRKELLGDEHAKVANCYNNLGLVYKNLSEYDKAITFFQRAITIDKKLRGEMHPILAKRYNNIGNVYIALGDPNSALPYLLDALDNRLQHYGENHIMTSRSYSMLGICYASKGDFENGLRYFTKSLNLQIGLLGPTHPALMDLLYNLGSIYQKKGDVAKGKQYIQRALDRALPVYGPNHRKVAFMYAQLGSAAMTQGNWDEARLYMEKSLAIRKELFGEEHLDVAVEYNSLGALAMKTQEWEKAESYFLASRKILEKIFGGKHPSMVMTLENLGDLYWEQGKNKVAFGYYQKSLALQKTIRVTPHPQISETYHRLAKVYQQAGNYQKALDVLASARTILSPQTQGTERGGMRKINREMNSFVAPLLVFTLKMEAEMLVERSAPNDREKASEIYQEAVVLSERIRKSYRLEETQLSWQEKGLPLYEGALNNLWFLYQHTQDEKYLAQAFDLAEKSKAALLGEALREMESRQLAGIPIEVLDLEHRLRVDRAFFEKRVFDEENLAEQKNTEKLTAYRDQLFALRQRHDSLMLKMELQYPTYFQLKYNPSTPSFKDIREGLTEDQALVEYFVGDSSLFVFVVDEENISFTRLAKKEALLGWIKGLKKAINHPNASGLVASNEHTFSDYAYKLYESLWKPIDANLPEKIIIVPDGMLGYLQFETLLSQPVTSSSSNRQLAYLLRQHEISYAYSASYLDLVQNTMHNQGRIQGLLAFAPEFQADKLGQFAAVADRRDSVGPLLFNQPEVKGIHELMGGELFLGSEATEAQFKARASQYQMVHIASHALADDEHPLYSRILFSTEKDTLEDGQLEVAELFNMELPAEMVVFSGCETGTGKLYRGEGIVSLARAASYAGAKSILTTLWSVNDASTSEIMQGFYGYLKLGKSKSEALRQAKLDYLSKSDQLSAHPFYWAAFVPVGDMNPLPKETPRGWGYLIAGICLAGWMGFSG